MSYWYLATPYSKFAGGIEAAYVAACKQTALLLKAGVPVFSPIAHSHSVAVHGDVDPLDHSIWLPADQPFMDCAHGLIYCLLPGHEESYGMKHELDYFRDAEKPVVFMTPDQLICVTDAFLARQAV